MFFNDYLKSFIIRLFDDNFTIQRAEFVLQFGTVYFLLITIFVKKNAA